MLAPTVLLAGQDHILLQQVLVVAVAVLAMDKVAAEMAPPLAAVVAHCGSDQAPRGAMAVAA